VYIYAGLDEGAPSHRVWVAFRFRGKPGFDTQVYDLARVARVSVLVAGYDLPEEFEREEKRVLGEGVEVVQVILKLSWPWIGPGHTIAEGRGYFFGGVCRNGLEKTASSCRRPFRLPTGRTSMSIQRGHTGYWNS
jgi:hypothetical protein